MTEVREPLVTLEPVPRARVDPLGMTEVRVSPHERSVCQWAVTVLIITGIASPAWKIGDVAQVLPGPSTEQGCCPPADLILRTWTYDGPGDTLATGTQLALGSAARAREHRRIARKETAMAI